MEESNNRQRPLAKRASRRQSLKFLSSAAAGAVLAGCAAQPPAAGSPAQSAPAASSQKPIVWKLQGMNAASDFAHTSPLYFGERVEKMSGGRLKIDVSAAGTIVPTGEILDAVHKDVIQAGYTWAGMWTGKHPAFGLFCGTDVLGMDHLDMATFLLHGGGMKLYNWLLQEELKYNVIAFNAIGDVPEPQGWFNKPVKSWADFKGLKFRAAGLSAEIFQEAGASVVTLAGGEIVPAGERKTIDAAEWSDPTSDMSLGFHEIWKYYHMPGAHTTCAWLEIIVNKTRYEELPADLKEIVAGAAMDTALYTWTKLWYQNPFDLETLKTKHGVQVIETPEEVLKEVLAATVRLYEKKAAQNATFAKVYEALKEFASRQVPYRRFAQPSYPFVADFHWKK